jgi:geranylgeranyl diphosphate synthase type I
MTTIAPSPAGPAEPDLGTLPDARAGGIDVAGRVERRIDDFLDAERRRWSRSNPVLAEQVDALAGLVLAPGKRLRPVFCYWGFVGAGGDPADPAVIDAGAALELLHASALIHDDIMDGSALRRGRRTVHLQYSDRHEEGAWLGEARRFGEGMAILVGDLAFVYADVLMGRAPREAVDVFNELRVELSMGQYLEVSGTARRQVDLDTVRWVAVYKSGKYSVERPLHLGAALAGRMHDLGEHFSAYGLPLGEAFQLRDDLLGVFGDEAVTGKPAGDDLREGKPTPLLAAALARADTATSALLQRVGSPDLDEQEISAIQAALIQTGARDEIERAIDDLAGTAVQSIRRAPVPAACRDHLVGLAAFVARRDR